MATSIGGILINVHFFFLLFYNDVNFKYFFWLFVIIFFTFHITLTLGLKIPIDDRICWELLNERTKKFPNSSSWYQFRQQKERKFFSLHSNYFFQVITTFYTDHFWTTGIEESFSVKNLNCYRVVAFPDSTLLLSHFTIISLTVYRNFSLQK